MRIAIKREIIEIIVKVALVILVMALSNALTLKLVYSIVWIVLALIISKFISKVLLDYIAVKYKFQFIPVLNILSNKIEIKLLQIHIYVHVLV